VTGQKQAMRDGKTIITLTIFTIGIVTKNMNNNNAEKPVVEKGDRYLPKSQDIAITLPPPVSSFQDRNNIYNHHTLSGIFSELLWSSQWCVVCGE
jgi:hypothetical protein